MAKISCLSILARYSTRRIPSAPRRSLSYSPTFVKRNHHQRLPQIQASHPCWGNLACFAKPRTGLVIKNPIQDRNPPATVAHRTETTPWESGRSELEELLEGRGRPYIPEVSEQSNISAPKLEREIEFLGALLIIMKPIRKHAVNRLHLGLARRCESSRKRP